MHNELAVAFTLIFASACHPAPPRTTDVGPSNDLCVQNLDRKVLEPQNPASGQASTPQELCPSADMESCLLLAIRAFAGDENNAPDRAVAVGLARDACVRGYARACTRLGHWLKAQDAPDLAEAFDVYLKGCKLGDMSSCFWAGVLLSRPHHYHFNEDWHQAFQLLTMACNGGKCSACGELAVLFREGRGCTRDAKRARSYQRLSKKLGCVE